MEAHLENLNLSKRLVILKEKLDIFRDLELWKSEVSSGNNCEFDTTNFPEDFRMLWKAIGAGTLVSDPPRFMGYHVINIDTPYKFDDSNSEWDLEFNGDELVEYSCGSASHRIENIYLVGHNDAFRFYGYDSTKIPYQFVCADDWVDYGGIISLLESKVSEMEWRLNTRTVGLGRDEYAFDWYNKAAKYGFASAQYFLGLCYKDGDGVDQDNLQAIHWFKLAAAQEYEDALFWLGVIYSTGVGISINDIEAFKCFKLASEKGHINAQWNLANCYIEGKGVLQDYFQAYMWINIICELSEGRDEGALLDRESYAKNLSDSEVIEVNKRSRAWLFNYFKGNPYVAVKYQD